MRSINFYHAGVVIDLASLFLPFGILPQVVNQDVSLRPGRACAGVSCGVCAGGPWGGHPNVSRCAIRLPPRTQDGWEGGRTHAREDSLSGRTDHLSVVRRGTDATCSLSRSEFQSCRRLNSGSTRPVLRLFNEINLRCGGYLVGVSTCGQGVAWGRRRGGSTCCATHTLDIWML